jgi:hypothetical protein
MEEILFNETTTIGLRCQEMERRVMAREICTVDTVYGSAKVKLCTYGSIRKIYPEYDSVAELARKTGKNFDEIRQAVIDASKTINQTIN